MHQCLFTLLSQTGLITAINFLLDQRSDRDIITSYPKLCREHISLILAALHWPSLRFRLEFQVLFLTYKTLNGLKPAYIDKSLINYVPLEPRHPLLLSYWRFQQQMKEY